MGYGIPADHHGGLPSQQTASDENAEEVGFSFEDYAENLTRNMLTDKVHPDAGKGTLKELSYLIHGLTGESGEVADLIKKVLRFGDMSVDNRTKMIEELGDVLWYWTAICVCLNVRPLEVAARNEQKLAERRASGTLKAR